MSVLAALLFLVAMAPAFDRVVVAEEPYSES